MNRILRKISILFGGLALAFAMGVGLVTSDVKVAFAANLQTTFVTSPENLGYGSETIVNASMEVDDVTITFSSITSKSGDRVQLPKNGTIISTAFTGPISNLTITNYGHTSTKNSDGGFAVYGSANGSDYTEVQSYSNLSNNPGDISTDFNTSDGYSYFKIVNGGNRVFLVEGLTITYENTSGKTIDNVNFSLTDSEKVWYVGDTVETSDLVASVTYSDSATPVEVTDSTKFTITSGATLSETGTQSVGVTYTDTFGSFNGTLTINDVQPEKILNRIVFNGDLTKKSYFDGENWDLSGLSLYAVYTSGSNELTPVDLGEVPALVSSGDLTLTLSPETALIGTTKLNISSATYVPLSHAVQSFEIKGITVSDAVKYKKYTASTLVSGDYVITATDSDKHKAMVNTFADSNNRRLNSVDYSLTDGKIVDPDSSIVFKITDCSTYFTVQDSSDKYLATYGKSDDQYITLASSLTDNGKWTVENSGDYFVFTNVAKSNQKLQLSGNIFGAYASNQYSTLTLFKKELPGIAVSTSRTDLGIGDTATVTAEFINDYVGHEGFATFSIDDDSRVTFTDNGNNTAAVTVKNEIDSDGTVIVTATIDDQSASILLNIFDVVVLTRIEINTENVKTNYVVGEEVDLANLVVTAFYSNNSQNVVANYDTDLSNVNKDAKGQYDVIISLTESEITKEESFKVTYNYVALNVTQAIAKIEDECPEVGNETASIYSVTGKVVSKEWNGNNATGTANIYIADKYNETNPNKQLMLWKAFQADKDSFNKLKVGASITADSKLKRYSDPVYETTQYPAIADYDKEVGKLVSSIFITSKHYPTKDSYYVGDETLDLTGLTVTIRYNDYSSDNKDDLEVSFDPENPSSFYEVFSVTGFDTSTDGYNTITITHLETGFTTTFQLYVNVVKIDHIEVTGDFDKEYASGETFDPTGMVVEAINNNGSSAGIISNDDLTFIYQEGSKFSDGDTFITIKYHDETLDKDFTKIIYVTVSDSYVTGIHAEFSLGEGPEWQDQVNLYDTGDTFKTKSLLVYIDYSNGDSVKYTDKNDSLADIFTITPPDMTKAGDADVTISYKDEDSGKTFTTTVTIRIKGVTGITASTTGAFRLIYRTGDTFSTQGLEIVENYSDGSTKDIGLDYEGLTITPPDMSVDGPEQEVLISYKGYTDTVTIDIWLSNEDHAALISSELQKLRDSVSEDDYTEANWITVQSYIAEAEDTLATFDPREDGEHYSSDILAVINAAKEKIASIAVRNLSKITITTEPYNTYYYVGEDLDLTGMVVIATYSDGSTKKITSYDVSEFDSSTLGEQTITISYGGKSDTFTVTVIEPEATLESITVTSLPSKTEYYLGEQLNISGLKITGHYSDGTDMEVLDYTVDGFDSDTVGVKTITVSSGGKTDTFEVEVFESPAAALAKAKENAIAEIEAYYNAIDTSNMSETQIAALLRAKQAAIAAINSATSVDEVNAAVVNGKAEMDNAVVNPPVPTPTPKVGLSVGAIVGISIGGAVVLSLGTFSLIWFVFKKKTFADLVAVFKKK